MTRRNALLLLACLPLAAAAAPIPKENDLAKLQRAYGTWSDPDKDCQFVLKGSELKVSLPATNHTLCSAQAGDTHNAPRALSEVEGDFTAVVRVKYPIPEGDGKVGWRYRSGGLVVWMSAKENFVLRLCGGGVNGHKEAVWGHQTTETHQLLMVLSAGEPTGTAYLRLKRDGNKLHAGYSRDGKTWKEFDNPAEVAWGEKVKVGVVAENCLGTPCEITFDEYTLTRPKKE